MSITGLLSAAAKSTPEAIFLRTVEGDLTYAQVYRQSAVFAGGLVDAGATAGEPVVLFMHNSLDNMVTWFALARLAAVHVPINTALIGAGLRHVFQVTGAHLAVVDAELLPALAAVAGDLPELRRVIVRGPYDGPSIPSLELVDLVALGRSGRAAEAVEVDELAAATVLFTSGTTGASKGCVLSHRYLVRQAELHVSNLGIESTDVLYAPFPLFHIDAATLTVVAALTIGGTAAIGRRFSASKFWDEARAFEATVFNFLGATLTILWKQPPDERDREHRVRLAWGVPMPEWKAAWEDRFGFPLYELYGLTDAGIPAYDPLDQPKRSGSCGRVIDEYDVTIVDADDQPVLDETVGEIAIRGREPGLVMNEYWAMPEATSYGFRGGWFHTGDLGRLDADGYLYFHGRAHDAIRRRGENISAFEVEQVLTAHPDIVEAAAVGVASELTEQDVKVYVVLRPGSALTPAEIHAYCAERAAPFMVPRYIEVVASLPKTPTQKVEKFRLVTDGASAATWDAERQLRS
jgi:carnitine-CoA ligase